MFYRFLMPPFRALALATWREAVLDVPNARADGARGHSGKNENELSMLAYSHTSFSAETSFLGRRCTSEQARQPEIV